MNEKQNANFDRQIRQTLGTLPDAPPPGSTFDAGKLWEQLRPELAAAPVTQKRIGGWWWTVAASVIGLLMGWFWWDNDVVSPERVTVHTRPIVPPLAVSSQHAGVELSVKRAVKTPAGVVQRSGAALGREAKKDTQNRPYSPTQHRYVVQLIPQQPITPESVSVTSVTETPKPTLAVAPKRRFRVVHENELPAEDEAYQVRSRAGQFVRLGTGGQLTAGPDEDLPQLRVPLSRKSIQ